MLEYRIVEKAAFTIVGFKRRFKMENSYEEVPKFWHEWMLNDEDSYIMGTLGFCADSNEEEFDYWIADVYFPWEEIPEGCETKVIPGGFWAEFPCTMETLQETNTKIWSKWLPELKGYSLAGNYDLELYLPLSENSEEMRVEIWIPLKKEV